MQASVSLSAAAPPGGLAVTLTSPDPARVLLSTNPAAVGQASIVLNVPAGQFGTPSFHVQGLQDNGTVNVTVTASGYTGDTVVVTLTPSGFIINSPSSISTNTRAGNTNVQITAARLNAALVPQFNQALRGGLTVNVSVTASGTAGTITTSPLTFTGGVSAINTAFDPVEEGSSTITVSVPAGFSTPAASRQITATVTAPAISFTNNTIGKDLQVQASVSLGAVALAGGTTVTVTSNTPSLLLLSTNPAAEGTASLQLAVPAGSSNIPTFHIQALAGAGTATVTASAPGYASATATFTLTPSGFIINSPGIINTTSFAANTTVQIASARLNPSGLAWQANQALRGGLSASVDVTSSNTNVGTITVSPLNFTNGNGIVNTAFDPANAGTTQISVGTPAGFSTPSTDRTLNATVTAPNVIASPVTVGRDLQAQTTVSLQNAPPAPVTITLTVNNPQNVTLTTDPLVAGSSSLTFPNISNTNGQTFFVQGRVLGSTTLTASAPGFNPITVSIDVHPSGFIVNSPGSISTNTFAANTNVQVASARLHPTTLAWQANQPLRGGMPTVNVPVTSSDVNVGTITISPLQFGPTVQAQSTQFDPRASGTTQIAVGVPAGFDTPSTDRTILATVTAPGVSANSATVGRDLQTSVGITLGVTPPSPVNVTVTSNAPTLTTLSLDPLVAGGTSVTFNNVTTTNVGTVFVQGRALGSTTLTVQAAGYNDATPVITIDPSGFIVNSPSSLTTTTFAANTNVQIASARLHPTTLAWQANQPLRGGMPTVNVSLTNQNDAVGVLTLTSLLFGPNVGTQNTAFDPIAEGTSLVSVVPPAGFSTPSTDRQMPVTVTAPSVSLGGNATVGRDLQISRSATLQTAPPSAVTVTFTVNNPGIATITSNPALAGGDVVSFTGVSTTSAGTLYIQGRAQGTTTITASAPGYAPDVITVEVRPSGFIINTPQSITTTAGAANTNIQITPAMLDPLTLNWQQNQAVRGGLNVNVTVTSSNTAAGTITVSPVAFAPNANTGATAFDPAASGVSTIAVVPPAGFDIPSSDRTIVATVNP
jgi:hypothetical protein